MRPTPPTDLSWYKAHAQPDPSFRTVKRDETRDRDLGQKIVEEDDHWGIYL